MALWMVTYIMDRILTDLEELFNFELLYFFYFELLSFELSLSWNPVSELSMSIWQQPQQN